MSSIQKRFHGAGRIKTTGSIGGFDSALKLCFQIFAKENPGKPKFSGVIDNKISAC